MEADLAFRTSYRLSEFYRGDESLGTLLNLVQRLDGERTSYLSWAQANDDERAMDRLRLQRDSGQKPTPQKPTIETYEYSPVVELLANNFELTQQLIHAVHTHQTKAAKRKPKLTRYPTPRTAAGRARKRLQKEAFRRMEDALVFSDEHYGPDSTLVKHSKHPASAGWAQPQPASQQRRARPNQLRPPRGDE